jgi:hypothetical protein
MHFHDVKNLLVTFPISANGGGDQRPFSRMRTKRGGNRREASRFLFMENICVRRAPPPI